MNNLSRLKMETPNLSITDDQLSIYLLENSIIPEADYLPTDKLNQIAIYSCALSVLESIANDPQLMKSYRTDDLTVSEFAENIQSRIDQLTTKIRSMKAEQVRSSQPQTNVFSLFKN
ncbi:hypothetical protein [Saccharibacillus brassicae]|uniref:Uncharacterized protein n=1 Tax=Saccharibacillus brassicae TaxID=2583377 RepID=A0A4Y6UQ73_SACBS|nr:hypothetical protein [Saccharibacillus brassicae]QDH19782.1 hypothetical protein FFV09_02215 [Saccharibacillus brassicae]